MGLRLEKSSEGDDGTTTFVHRLYETTSSRDEGENGDWGFREEVCHRYN